MHLGEDTSYIIELIDTKLHAIVQAASKVIVHENTPVEPAELKAIKTMLSNIANFGFNSLLIKNMHSVYRVTLPSECLSKLDARDDMLGFDDGLYDFKLKVFRDGKPDDMLTLSTGHKYKDVQDCDPEKLEVILMALASLHESDEVFRYVMHFLATPVTGDRPKDTFHI